MRRGSTFWRGLRGGGGRGWMVGGLRRRLVFRSHPGVVAAAPLVLFRPHPSAVAAAPRLLSRPHPNPLPHGRGGKRWAACAAGCSSALTPALSLAGEGVRDGAALTPALSLAGEGAGGGWAPGVCGGRGRWWAAAPPVLFRPHPGPLPRGRGGRTSALTPALSLAGEGAGGGRLPGVCGGGVDGGRLRRRLLFRPHPSPLPHGRGGRTSALTPALSLAGEGAGLPSSPQPSPSRARGPRGGWAPGVCGGGVDGGRLCRRFSSALTPALSLAGEGVRGGWLPGVLWWAAAPPVALPPSPQPSPSRARGPDFRPHPSPLPRGRGGKIAPPVAFCCVLVLLLCSLARAGSYCLMPQASLHNPRTMVTPAFFYSAPARSQGERTNAGRVRVDTYAQGPIMDVCGAAYALRSFPVLSDSLTLQIT